MTQTSAEVIFRDSTPSSLMLKQIKAPHMNRVFCYFLTLILGLLATQVTAVEKDPDFQKVVAAVLEHNCVDCHSEVEPEGNFNMVPLLKKGSTDDHHLIKSWAKIEEMVSSAKMPPKDVTPLTESERQGIVDWFRETYIFRNGKEHIGPNSLRRLTRYELENTLEELLQIKLKPAYVFSSESAGLTPSTIEQLYPNDIPGLSGFTNDADQLQKSKIPILELINCVDFALRAFDQNSNARKKVIGFSDKKKKLDFEGAKQVLAEFSKRASRGYHNTEEFAGLIRTYEQVVQEKSSYVAIRAAIKKTLLSPSFLYRMEIVRDQAKPYPVSANELAVRLSYFLWSSMPDEELFAAAADDSLLQEDVLKQQIRRMLNSPKRIALSESFAGQWLGFDELVTNDVYYEGENYTRGIYDELLFSFDELIKSDRSILEIVDADWVYLRQDKSKTAGGGKTKLTKKFTDIFAERRRRSGLKLERFYNPPELYQVKNDYLGGLITTSGIMRLTSAPKRTNPIRRGVWVSEKMIGVEMKPPENVPPLAESEKKLAGTQAKGIVALLKAHTANATCQACHQHIDPLGLGLENFSPNGEWRTRYADKSEILSNGTLPNGREFQSPKQLKQELLSYYKDRLTKNIIHKMLSYAIGRELSPCDRPTVERIQANLEQNEYRMTVLIEQIVLSKPFLNRQDK